MRRSATCLFGVLICLAGLDAAQAAALAEIVSVSGRGEVRITAQDAWQAARVKQALDDGHYVRTLDASSMALLFAGQTQIKLGSESLFLVRASGVSTPATLDLKKGRSWAQVKSDRPDAATPTTDSALLLRVQTPSGVAAIRGTEWVIEVTDDGQTTVTVFDGQVEFGNEQGSVSIGASEEATARPGTAPVKRQLLNPRSRVQWVAGYRFPWPRYPELQFGPWRATAEAIKDGRLAEAVAGLRARATPLAALLQAELALARGTPEAVDALLAGMPDAEPRAAVLRAEAALRRDETALARQLLTTLVGQTEADLTLGEIDRIDGLAQDANTAYARARAAAPQDPRGFLGGARVAAETDDLRNAWALLGQARQLSPQDAEIVSEQAQADVLGNRLALARAGFAQALALAPDDFVALTGQGLLELKAGQPQAALELLRQATAIEPLYARAVLYAGVAYWQLGQTQVALETMQRASRLDANDPLPHFYRAMMFDDRLEPGAAVVAARQAIALWPRLKSLNSVVSDQKGSANLGATLRRFGLDESAQAAAWQSYSPFWGASHLFLADRLHDTYSKNSELFQGFLADPLVFGADPRQNTLLARPESVWGLRLKTANGAQRANDGGVQWVGNRVEPFASAWFVDLEKIRARPDDKALGSRLGNATIGLGLQPQFDSGWFLFANRYRLDIDFTDPNNQFNQAPARVEPTRLDVGFHHKFAPDSQLWLKLGGGNQSRSIEGPVPKKPTLLTPEPSMVYDYQDDSRNRELQGKLSWQAGRHSLHVTLEHAREDTHYRSTENSRTGNKEAYVSSPTQQQQRRSWRIGFNDAWQLSPSLQWHLQAAYVNFEQNDAAQSFVSINARPQVNSNFSKTSDTSVHRLSPRIGLVWQPDRAADGGAGLTLRLAAREWTHPAGAATLDRLDSAGLPLDTRTLQPGGVLRNHRAQLEWQGSSSFYVAHIEQQRFENPTAGWLPSISNVLSELEKLRQQAADDVSGQDLLEGTPRYPASRSASNNLAIPGILNGSAGRIRTLGLAGNWVIDPRWSGYARLTLRESTDLLTRPGADLPYSPRRTLVLGGSHFPGGGWTLGTQVVYRSQSLSDDAVPAVLPSGWALDGFAGWRSTDRSQRLTLLLKNLGRERPAPRSALLQWQLWW